MPGPKFRTVHKYGKKRKKALLNFRKKVPQISANVATNETVDSDVVEAAVEARLARQHRNGLLDPDPGSGDGGDADRVQADEENVASSSLVRSSDGNARNGDAHPPATEYMIVHLEAISRLLAMTVCRTCRGNLSVARGEREYGLAAKLCIVCSNCGLTDISEWSSPRVAGTAACNPFEVNVLASRAAKSVGLGPTALNNMLSTMGICRKKEGRRKKRTPS